MPIDRGKATTGPLIGVIMLEEKIDKSVWELRFLRVKPLLTPCSIDGRTPVVTFTASGLFTAHDIIIQQGYDGLLMPLHNRNG